MRVLSSAAATTLAVPISSALSFAVPAVAAATGMASRASASTSALSSVAVRFVAGVPNSGARILIFRVRGRDNPVQLNRLIFVVLMKTLAAMRVADRAAFVNELAVVRYRQRRLIRTRNRIRRGRRPRTAKRTRRRIVLLRPAAEPRRLWKRLERRRLEAGSVGQPVRCVIAWLVTAVATGCRKQQDESQYKTDRKSHGHLPMDQADEPSTSAVPAAGTPGTLW